MPQSVGGCQGQPGAGSPQALGMGNPTKPQCQDYMLQAFLVHAGCRWVNTLSKSHCHSGTALRESCEDTGGPLSACLHSPTSAWKVCYLVYDRSASCRGGDGQGCGAVETMRGILSMVGCQWDQLCRAVVFTQGTITLFGCLCILILNYFNFSSGGLALIYQVKPSSKLLMLAWLKWTKWQNCCCCVMKLKSGQK